ncbi:MAG: S-layer homology domain-containing protein [Oscillospiraceae bacterium]|jgi:lysophospholipase L1-like esterase|nr:S-layer homology domain-containing protein [Oscillospiraceae bacterium]
MLMKRILATVIAASLIAASPAGAEVRAGFPDVAPDSWYYDAVTVLTEMKIIEGFPSGNFEPEQKLTVAQFIKLLNTVVLDEPETEPPDSKYFGWADGYYYAALGCGVIADGEFDVRNLDTAITRYDMSLLLARAVGGVLEADTLILPDVTDGITDIASVPALYLDAVKVVYGAGLVSGYPNGSFGGDKTLSRAEGATVILRLIDPAERTLISRDLPEYQPPETPAKREFVPEDTLFIGDSLTHGLYLYGKMRTANYLYSTGMTVFKAPTESFTSPSGGSVTLATALKKRKYNAVYILLGINELGSSLDKYAAAYKTLIELVQKAQPDAEIYVTSILPVSKARSENGGGHTRARVLEHNERLRGLAEQTGTVYADVFSVFADKENYLPSSYTWDGVHLNTPQYVTWAEYLRAGD